MLARYSQALAQRLKPKAQHRQFALDHIPDEREIDAEVFVDKLVRIPAICRHGTSGSRARCHPRFS